MTYTVALFVLALVASPATAQTSASRCADCHFANPQSDPAPGHLTDWEYSPHGRNNVGCERCHGGDPSTFEPFLAHQGILASGNPSSPVHRANLPRTCGACHIGPFVAFQKSRHFALLAEDDEGPTCTTCHDSVAAQLLSPRGLEKQCESCHGQRGTSPHTDFPPLGRILQERVSELRELLRPVPGLLRRVDDAERRAALEEAYRQAEVPLIEAVNAGHEFVFDNMEERLAVARERAERLLDELANPENAR